MKQFEISPLGDRALLLRPDSEFERSSPDPVASLLEARDQIAAANIPGVGETVLGYASIALFFDPGAAVRAGAPLDEISGWIEARVRQALSGKGKANERAAFRSVDIPVCYDSEFGIDLEHVARHADLALEEVIRRHEAAHYCVRCIGFTPGFPYLSGLPLELATPRRASPRKSVPAGSVAIGGRQAGIYPAASPGGWNVIGRTPLPLFDPRREPPALLRAGDYIRFRAITRAEFSAAAAQLT